MTRAEEKLMWQTYWRLNQGINPQNNYTEKEIEMYNTAENLLQTELYTSNKVPEGFSLPTFQRLMSLLCKRH